MADLQNYRAMMRINKHRLDDELEIQSQVLEEIGRRIVTLESRVQETQREVKIEEARVFLQQKDDGATDKVADAKAKVSREVQAAWMKYQAARHEHDEWVEVYECFKSKSFHLQSLGSLYHDQYFQVDELRPHKTEQTSREAMHEMRKNLREAVNSRDEGPSRRRRVVT